jgi:excinuclease ABC subunit C
MLQRIRDEAHRFAITFHRSKRSKVMLESLLDEIPTLGDVRRKALLEKFGSVAALKKSTLEEISAIPGIGEKTALQILDALSESAAPTEIIDMQTGEIITQD